MEHITPEVVDAAQGFWRQTLAFMRLMLLPWRLWQVGAILALLAVAHLGRKAFQPRLNAWLRSRKGWPKWRLRLGILVQRNMRVILFVLLAWSLAILMRQLTWPSRSQLIVLAAMFASVWIAIEFGVRIIGNRFLRRIVYWAAWIWTVLYFLELLHPVEIILDSLAIHVAQYRLSALDLVRASVATGLLIAFSRVVSRVVSSSLAKSSEVTPTMRVLISKFLQIIFVIIAVLVGLKIIGVDLTGITVFSGAVGLGLGFGLQKVVSNLVSGVIILLDKSIKPGDVISLGENVTGDVQGDNFGWIDALGARYVSVVTRDGREYLIPNEDLVTGQVINWSHTNTFVRLDIEFEVSYYDDPHEVTRVAIKAAMTVKRVLAQRTPVCWITGFGEGRIKYLLRFWISDPAAGVHNIRGHVYLALWDAFQKNDITLPFPQREVRVLREPPPAIADPGRKPPFLPD